MLKKECAASLLEVLVVATVASILLITLLEIYQFASRNLIRQQQIYDHLQQLILADTQLRHQLKNEDYQQCAGAERKIQLKGYENQVPINTSLQIKPGSSSLMVDSCRKIGESYAIAKTYFFIAKNAEDNFYSLYEKINNQNSQRIASGIDNMKLLFGVYDAAQTPMIHHLNSSAIADWQKVISVEIQFDLTAMHSDPMFPDTWNIYAALPK